METKTGIKVLTTNAWINKMPIEPAPGGALHVKLVIEGTKQRAELIKKNIQGINPKILLLEISISATNELITKRQNLSYSEMLQRKKQYSEISIIYNGHNIKEIKDIKEIS